MWKGALLAAVALAVFALPGARAQAQPLREALRLLARWAEAPPRNANRAIERIAALNKEARGGGAAKARADLARLYRDHPIAFRDLIQARRRYLPVGTPVERVEQLRYTLAVAVEGLVHTIGLGLDGTLAQMRGRSAPFAGRVLRFDQAATEKDFASVDREFTVMSRALAEVYDYELQRAAAPASAAPRASPSAAAHAQTTSTTPAAAIDARPSPVPSASASPAGPAAPERTGRERAARTVRGLLLLAAIGYGVRWYRRRRAGADLTAPLGLLARGQPDAALAALQAALPLAATNAPEVRLHMVRCMVRMGQIELAMQALSGIDRERVSPRALYLLARDLEERGQTKVALELYARVYLTAADLEDTKERYERLRAASGLSAAILSPSDLMARLPARYAKAELLGHGGMGVVLKAHDQVTGATVALKVIAPAVASDSNFVGRFRREIRALSSLDHPAIIKILDSAITPFPFYAMELLTGQTLTDLLKPGALPEDRAVRLLEQAAQGLASAHERGVVHRDVKPDNIMIEEGDRVKLLDFGLAHLSGATSLTQTGMTAGSAPFMSPEQLRGEPTIPATDVYALGLVMYQVLAGRAPFGTAQPLVRLSREPDRLAGVSEPLAELVATCTALDPERRPAMMAVALRLKALAQDGV